MHNTMWSRKSFHALAVLVILFSISTIWFLKSASASGTPISLTTPNVAYTQDFNTLASTGTSSTVPAGWAFSESGANLNTTYTAGTGSSTTGDTYSFGSTGSTDRAFGQLRSSNLVSTIGAQFTNSTGGTIASLAIQYVGEEWRLGRSTPTIPDSMFFAYSLNATSLTTG